MDKISEPSAGRSGVRTPGRGIIFRELDIRFLSSLMKYDCGESFLFDCELSGIPFSSKSKGKLLLR